MPVTPKLFGMLGEDAEHGRAMLGAAEAIGRQLGLEHAQRGDAQILVRQGPVIFDIGEGHASCRRCP